MICYLFQVEVCTSKMAVRSASVLFFQAITVISCIVICAGTYTDYCVIGAGPGGLQMGYFLQKAGRDYVIYEKSNISGNNFILRS